MARPFTSNDLATTERAAAAARLMPQFGDASLPASIMLEFPYDARPGKLLHFANNGHCRPEINLHCNCYSEVVAGDRRTHSTASACSAKAGLFTGRTRGMPPVGPPFARPG